MHSKAPAAMGGHDDADRCPICRFKRAMRLLVTFLAIATTVGYIVHEVIVTWK
jgi:hypothetical protein